MDRRAFTIALVALCGCGQKEPSTKAVAAQQPATKVWRLGYLGSTTPEGDPLWDTFRHALEERGYIEGKNLSVERRYSASDEQFPALVLQLVRLNPDVIVTIGSPATRAAKEATSTIPIVMVAAGDPVGRGLVNDLAHPGGNVTGTTELQIDLIPKRLELLKAAVPKASRVVILSYPGALDAARLVAIRKEQAVAAQALGVTLLRVELATPQGFDKATAEIVNLRPDALLLAPTPVNFVLRKEIADFATARLLPTIAARREQALAGILVSYGSSLADTGRDPAAYVDKILKGAKPADLSVEQATKFEFVINLKTAKALGLTIPQSVLLRADEVIE